MTSVEINDVQKFVAPIPKLVDSNRLVGYPSLLCVKLLMNYRDISD